MFEGKYAAPAAPIVRSALKSIWLFPVLCVICVALLTCFRISGSSVGAYYGELYGGGAKDSNLLAGRPRDIRSDEWEFETQMISAQAVAGFPHINKNIGDGQNMAVITDVPYKNWSIVFRPQNLAFFVLPLAYAFAFKWWFLAFMLVVSCYFFILMLLPRKRLLASILSASLLLTPFVQWWYQTITLAPLFYSLLITVITIRLMESRRTSHQVSFTILLGYLLTCFALVLYPPFQIPCAIVTVVFLLGYFIEKKYYTDKRQLLRRSALLGTSLVIFAAFTLGFLFNNKAALSAVRQSYYPGQRVAPSGGFNEKLFLTSFLAPEFQLTGKARHYPANQSEASNFLLVSPFLSLAVIYTTYKTYRLKKAVDWPLLLITLLFGLFMVRLFIPHTDFLFKLLGLESVPHARLLIGVGLASFMQIILLIRHFTQYKTVLPKVMAVGLGLGVYAISLLAGLLTSRAFPGFIDSSTLIIVLSAFPAILVTLILLRRYYYAAGLLLLFSFVSSAAVNPLYRGLGPVANSAVMQNIKTISLSEPTAKWAVLDNLTSENFPAMAGAPSITGIYAYPQLKLWQKSPETAPQKDAYNRYAHTLVKFENRPTYLDLIQPDYFVITASPCAQFFSDLHVRYFLAEKDYSSSFSCLSLKKTVDYPNKTLYILEIR